jgi:hypothetical protein
MVFFWKRAAAPAQRRLSADELRRVEAALQDSPLLSERPGNATSPDIGGKL